MSAHRLALQYAGNDQPGKLRAECSCGWVGSWFEPAEFVSDPCPTDSAEIAAVEDGTEHLVALG